MGTSGPRVVPPRPPADLARLTLPVAIIPTRWFRLTQWPSAIFWSRQGKYRFDSPTAKWGVCYMGESPTTAFQEVFADKLRKQRRALSWLEIEKLQAWQIDVIHGLKTIELQGETLAVIQATVQSFVSGYKLSQEWGRELMNHPDNIDGIQYIGRRSGRSCLALFGDDAAPKPHQAGIRPVCLGTLVTWKGFWPFVDRVGIQLYDLPASVPRPSWSA